MKCSLGALLMLSTWSAYFIKQRSSCLLTPELQCHAVRTTLGEAGSEAE